MTDGAAIVMLAEWKAPSRAACTHSALPVSMSTTARLAVTTASGSNVALSRRTRDPVGGAPPGGASACSGSAGSGCRSGIDHLRHSGANHSEAGLRECDIAPDVDFPQRVLWISGAAKQSGPLQVGGLAGVQGGHDVVDEVAGVLAAGGEADEAGGDGVAPALPAVGG